MVSPAIDWPPAQGVPYLLTKVVSWNMAGSHVSAVHVSKETSWGIVWGKQEWELAKTTV